MEKYVNMPDDYLMLRVRYDENDDNTQVLYLKNAVATFGSFTAAPEVHTAILISTTSSTFFRLLFA